MSLFGESEPHVVEELTTAQRFHLNAWTVFAVFFGGLLGLRMAVAGWPPLRAVLGGMILMPLFLRLFVWVILSGSARVGRQIYNPSGSRTPSRPGYSGPESLAVRGRYLEAIDAYEVAAAEEPDDPEPWLRIARIERMDLKRPARALEALRAARGRTEPGSPTALLISREIVELYLRDPKHATRAMPELARIAADFPGTPSGKWAREQLAELKAGLAAGDFDQWVKEPGAPGDAGRGATPGSSSDEPGDREPPTSRGPD